MTITVAWERKSGEVEELVVATDSRLRDCGSWDIAPKIQVLPGTGAVLAFAGDTCDAYPMFLQAVNACLYFRATRMGYYDITELKGHLLRMFNDMRVYKSDPDAPNVTLLLAGYSWRYAKYYLWGLSYDGSTSQYKWEPARGLKGFGDNRLIVLGNPSMSNAKRNRLQKAGETSAITKPEDDLSLLFKERLVNLLQKRGIKNLSGYNMEPFEVIRDMLRCDVSSNIGGPPQVVKLYKHLNCQPFVVKWKQGNSDYSLLGRPLMDYEQYECPIIDPDYLEV